MDKDRWCNRHLRCAENGIIRWLLTVRVSVSGLLGKIYFYGSWLNRNHPVGLLLPGPGRHEEAVENLAYLRHEDIDSASIVCEMAEIEVAIREEQEIRRDLELKEAFLAKGKLICFVIASVIFLLQQWSGQNSAK